MRLEILGSGSSANCYILNGEKEALVIEAGVKLLKVKEQLEFDISKVKGLIVTHFHQDHAEYIKDYALYSSIPIYTSQGTIDSIEIKGNPYNMPRPVRDGEKFEVGGFEIIPFDVIHDAKEPLGFLIRHPECGVVLFLTDSKYSEFKFNGLANILIESNYCKEIVEQKAMNDQMELPMLRRLMDSHMSIQTCKELLSANDLSQVNNIVLLHLSDGNSDEARFKKEVEDLTGKTVTIADRGVSIDFNKNPF
jgi:phosphoribosyl 1,2-cyclic phosphodiesterase